MRFLKITSVCCSFIYYLTDNIVYLANLDLVSAFVPYLNKKLKWKQIKNIFSLTKTVLEVIIAIYSVVLKRREESNLNEKLNKCNNTTIQWNSEANVLIRNIIGVRTETNLHLVDASINIMRMFMLVSSLKIPGHQYLDPIFVAICGLGQAFANVVKGMRGKKDIYKLTIEDIEQQ